jgi:hypothetical protein
LVQVSRRDDLHPLLAGRFCRLLRDEGRIDADEVARTMSRTLTIGVPPAAAASWVEGFLAGGGLLLVHDRQLLALIDNWLAGIPADSFVDALPLLRRTFAAFAAPERRAIGERARNIGSGPAQLDEMLGDLDAYDLERALLVAPVLRAILGVDKEHP